MKELAPPRKSKWDLWKKRQEDRREQLDDQRQGFKQPKLSFGSPSKHLRAQRELQDANDRPGKRNWQAAKCTRTGLAPPPQWQHAFAAPVFGRSSCSSMVT